MIKNIVCLIMLAFASYEILAQEITKVPAARTVEDSQRLFEARLNVFMEVALKRPIISFRDGGFAETVMARLFRGQGFQEINQVILDPNTTAYAEVGTDFDGVLGLCKRHGDYDFKLTELIPVTYEGLKRNAFSTEAYQKILSKLLTVYGNKHQTWVSMGGCFKVPETENHTLMIESARYLTNQLWNVHYPANPRFDNEKNGFNEWFLKHLQKFLKKDFEEYNSRPYQGHAIAPIRNLANYAMDERVKLAATMVLDYISAKFATQSSQLRRSAPICRQHEYAVLPNLLNGDHMTAMYAQLAGNTQIYRYNNPSGVMTYGASSALLAGLGKYRPHNIILDMIIHNDKTLDQRFHHDGVESYYKHPKFVLTAGGRYLNRFDAGMKKRDGWAYPTSIMSNSGGEIDRNQLVRFEGAFNEQKRNNMCQFKNFACGMNFKLPNDLPAECLIDKGEWKFLNYNSNNCPLKFGYYVAIHLKSYPKPGLFQKRLADDFGTFEVVDAEGVDFEAFMSAAINNNKSPLKVGWGNSYITYDAKFIEFNPGLVSLGYSPIQKVDGDRPFPEKFSNWPFLSGDFLTSSGDGRIVIKNKKLELSLILDYRNPLAPEKRIIRTGL